MRGTRQPSVWHGLLRRVSAVVTSRGLHGVAAILGAALWIGGAPEALAAGEYHVDGSNPACSNSGPGSSATPYCTILAAAAAKGGPGTTLLVKPGIYREQVTVPASGAAGNPFVIKADGSPVVIDGADDYSSPSLWTSYSGNVWLTSVPANPQQVFVDGARLAGSAQPPDLIPAGTFRFDGSNSLYLNIGGDNPGDHETFAGRRASGFRLNGRSWVVIDGFTMTRQEDAGVNLLGASNNCTIVNNAANLARNNGITVRGGSLNILIESNRVFDNANHGIYLLEGITDSTVQDNESFANAKPGTRVSNGIKLENSSRILVQRNRLHHNQDTGLQINHSSDNDVFQNMSWGNGDHGYDQLDSSGTLYSGNVAWGNFKDGFSVEGGNSATRIVNSISFDNGLTNGRYNLWVDPNSISGLSSDYNVLWNSNGQPPIRFIATTYATLAAFTAATGHDAHSTQADPLLVDAANGDFRPLPDSPAIDSADASPDWPPTDAEGKPRVDDPSTPDTGTGPITFADRGAFEFDNCGGGGGQTCGTSEIGECALGTAVCAGDLTCVGAIDPAPETCDGLDNDCDGTNDNGFAVGEACSAGVGECYASGLTVCSADGSGTTCSAVAGAPAPETCDGLDNDCDGATDNGFALGGSCSVGVGECSASGLTVCSADGSGTTCGAVAGTPAPESCDGLDNDCDGATDNGFTLGAACTLGMGQCAAPGLTVCSADGSGTTCDAIPVAPAPETCDGLDNDCDGATDNGFAVGEACTAGVGQCAAPGLTLCSADGSGTICSAVAGAPAPEICDGIDNDCNGAIDDAALPSGAADVAFQGSDLSWPAIAASTAYDVVRGDLSLLKSTGGDFTASTQACSADGIASTTVPLSELPAPGQGFWYLVRPMNCGGAGSYDSGAASQIGQRDTEVNASPQSCH